ncbi:zinc finger protein 64 3 and 4-like protein, partial [Aphelenchoides avenae]
SRDASPATSVTNRTASTRNASNYVDYGEDEPRARKPRKSDTPRHVYMTRRRSKAIANDAATANEASQDCVVNRQAEIFSAEGLQSGAESDDRQESKNDEESDHKQSEGDEEPELVVTLSSAKPGKIRLPRPTASARRARSPPPLEMHHEDEFPPPDQRNALQQMSIDQLSRNGQLMHHHHTATSKSRSFIFRCLRVLRPVASLSDRGASQQVHGIMLGRFGAPYAAIVRLGNGPSKFIFGYIPKPHRCEYCDYRTAVNSDLHLHKRRKHNGVKPYACDVQSCGYRAAKKGDLSVHLRRHTGEKPHKCPKCDYRATEKGQLNSHIRRKHTF